MGTVIFIAKVFLFIFSTFLILVSGIYFMHRILYDFCEGRNAAWAILVLSFGVAFLISVVILTGLIALSVI